MKKSTQLSIKQLDRLRRVGLLGIIILIVVTPLLAVLWGASKPVKVWMVVAPVLVAVIILIYIGLSIHHLFFRRKDD